LSGINPTVSKKSHAVAASRLPDGALLVGHFYGVFGLGSLIRSAVPAFEAAGIPFHLQNAWGNLDYYNSDLFEKFPYFDRMTVNSPHKANIFFMNANEMKSAFNYLGSKFFKGKYNIGYWAWELPDFPNEWLPAFQYVDEIWAMSLFVRESIAKKANCPVIHMPLSIQMENQQKFHRRYFGLPTGSFIFLYFFDFKSYIARKNPQAVISAFRMAFPDNDNHVRLVIKITGTDEHYEEYSDFIENAIGDDPRIITIATPFKDIEMNGLIDVCDCFISLHRSEGYGQGIAEAMLHGKPVITTAYSGNMDFTTEDNSCLVNYKLIPVKEGEYPYGKGQIWADPDLDQAAWYMKKLISDPALCRILGQRAESFIRENLNPAVIGNRYRRRLEVLGLIKKSIGPQV